MNISPTSSSTALALKFQQHRRMAAAGVVTVALLVIISVWWPSNSEQRLQVEDNPLLNRPLFAGWIQPGQHNFGPKERAPTVQASTQPKWVLATEPNEQEIQLMPSTLPDHPDKDSALSRLVDQSHTPTHVALWNEWQSTSPAELSDTSGSTSTR